MSGEQYSLEISVQVESNIFILTSALRLPKSSRECRKESLKAAENCRGAEELKARTRRTGAESVVKGEGREREKQVDGPIGPECGLSYVLAP